MIVLVNLHAYQEGGEAVARFSTWRRGRTYLRKFAKDCRLDYDGGNMVLTDEASGYLLVDTDKLPVDPKYVSEEE